MTPIEQLRDEMAALRLRFEQHVEAEERMWHDAFPNGDMAGHRLAHEQMISAAQEQAKFWADLRLDLAKKGLWALLLIIVTLAAAGGWTWVLTKLAAGPAVMGRP